MSELFNMITSTIFVIFVQEWFDLSMLKLLTVANCNKTDKSFIQKIWLVLKRIALTNKVLINFDAASAIFRPGFKFYTSTNCESPVSISLRCTLKTRSGRKLLMEDVLNASLTLYSIPSNTLVFGKNLQSVFFYNSRGHSVINKNMPQSWLSLCSELSFKTHPQLTVISFCGNESVTDDSIMRIAKMFNMRLQQINLHGCSSLTDKSVGSIAKYCSKVTSLDIGNCNGLTGKSITSLTNSSCSAIQSLFLGGVHSFLFGSHEVSKLIEKIGCTLKTVDLSNFADSQMINALTLYCGNLEDLSINNNTAVYSQDINKLCSKCFNITKLNITKATIQMTHSAQFAILTGLSNLSDFKFSITSSRIVSQQPEHFYPIALFAKKLKSIVVCDLSELHMKGTLPDMPVDLSQCSLYDETGNLNSFLLDDVIPSLCYKCLGSLRGLCLTSLFKELSAELFFTNDVLRLLTSITLTCSSDDELFTVAAICHNLHYFDVVESVSITSAAVVAVCVSNHNLHTVRLGAGHINRAILNASLLDDSVLIDGICKLRFIRSLTLETMSKITHAAMEKVVQSCGELQGVHLSDCELIDCHQIRCLFESSDVMNSLKVF